MNFGLEKVYKRNCNLAAFTLISTFKQPVGPREYLNLINTFYQVCPSLESKELKEMHRDSLVRQGLSWKAIRKDSPEHEHTYRKVVQEHEPKTFRIAYTMTSWMHRWKYFNMLDYNKMSSFARD